MVLEGKLTVLAWADNANRMSQNYTGSDALKVDFTRTGKRNIKGAMSDGFSSVKRYYNQNFQGSQSELTFQMTNGKIVSICFLASLRWCIDTTTNQVAVHAHP